VIVRCLASEPTLIETSYIPCLYTGLTCSLNSDFDIFIYFPSPILPSAVTPPTRYIPNLNLIRSANIPVDSSSFIKIQHRGTDFLSPYLFWKIITTRTNVFFVQKRIQNIRSLQPIAFSHLFQFLRFLTCFPEIVFREIHNNPMIQRVID